MGKDTETSKGTPEGVQKPLGMIVTHEISVTRTKTIQTRKGIKKRMNTLEPNQPIMNTSPKENLRQALRFVEAGHSLMEAETLFGFSRRDLEHHLIQAKNRQTLIRQHLQSRPRLTSVLRYPERGPWGISNYFGNCPGYLVVDSLD